MHTVNNDTIKAMGKRHAFVALDQNDEFGTVADTLAAYRENLIDTLNDEGLAAWAWMAVDAFDREINKNRPDNRRQSWIERNGDDSGFDPYAGM